MIAIKPHHFVGIITAQVGGPVPAAAIPENQTKNRVAALEEPRDATRAVHSHPRVRRLAARDELTRGPGIGERIEDLIDLRSVGPQTVHQPGGSVPREPERVTGDGDTQLVHVDSRQRGQYQAVGTIAPDVMVQFGIVAGPLSQIPGWLAIYFYARYGIDKARHREIRRALDLRRP